MLELNIHLKLDCCIDFYLALFHPKRVKVKWGRIIKMCLLRGLFSKNRSEPLMQQDSQYRETTRIDIALSAEIKFFR